MSTPPDTLIMNNTFAQVTGGSLLITPTGGTQTTLAAALAGSDTTSANGMPAAGVNLPLTRAMTVAGVALTASATSTGFGIAVTPGTSEDLVTTAANSTTVTTTALFELALPQTYVSGKNITVTANTNYTIGSGTLSANTLAMSAYLCANAGTQGATIIATAAQTVPAAAGDVTFTITGTTLTSGARLMLKAVLVITETAGSNVTAQINSIRLS
jgi:hypothetical protein